MPEWALTTIGDVLTLQRGFDITRTSQEPGDVPVVSSGGIKSHHSVAMVAAPGVVIGRKGTLGTVFYMDKDFWPHDTTLWVKDFKGNSPRFVYYFLKTQDLARHDVGSSNPTLNRNHVHPISVRWPTRPVQDAIAEVLGALDDKIAVNERIAATSRELALAYFNSALRRGAIEFTVGSKAALLSRGVTPRYTDDVGGLLIINQKCVRGGRVNLLPSRRTLGEVAPADKVLWADDVLVNSTGVGTLGRVARWSIARQATVDSHVTIVRFDSAKIDPLVAGFAMLRAQPTIEAMGEGSTGQTELSRAKLASLSISVPREFDKNDLAARLRPLEHVGDAVLRECGALAELRDTLLPKLMSGELRIRDAERLVEEAT